MHQNRNLGVREHLNRLAAEDESRDAAAPMRGHHNEVTAFRLCAIDDGPERMFVFDVERFTRNPRCLCRAGGCAKHFRRALLRGLLVLGWCIFDHLCLEGEHVKGRGNCQHRNLGLDRLGQSDAVLNGLPRKFRAVCWYQDIRLHFGLLVWHGGSCTSSL
jgi:hypothetical protein